jgi:L-iditol 2-dehydrogenase
MGPMKQASTPAVFLTGIGRLEHREVSIPEPGEGEVSIRVTAVGLCGSDAHWYEEGEIGDASLDGDLILGHEFAGVIESGARSGERVAVDPAIPCLRCAFCLSGRSNLCSDLRFAGHGSTDGALRQRLTWPERALVALPESLSDEEGALLEPLGVALHAIDIAGVDSRHSAGIFGCGPIGLLLVTALRSMGVEQIVVTDRFAHRLEAASQLGATTTLLATEDGAERSAVEEVTKTGLDAVFETAGTDSALNTALVAARPGAKATIVGIPNRDRTSLVASLARRKELTLAFCRRMLPADLVRAAALAGEGSVQLSGLITHRYPLAEAASAFTTLTQRLGLKVIVEP